MPDNQSFLKLSSLSSRENVSKTKGGDLLYVCNLLIIPMTGLHLAIALERQNNDSEAIMMPHEERFLTTREAAWYIIVLSVRMPVCLSNDIFRKP